MNDQEKREHKLAEEMLIYLQDNGTLRSYLGASNNE